jgi:hypothetical protein
MSILIISNLPQLRYSGDYLKNIGIEFRISNGGPFEMAQSNPDVIISNSYHEILAATKKYPSISFLGQNLKFPNYDMIIPTALLDELSVLNKIKVDCQPCDITYFNNGKQENTPFIERLRALGNLKIMGPGYCIDELDKSFPQRATPSFYAHGKVVAATSKEEALKGLFMGKPVISDGVSQYAYSYTDGDGINLTPRSNQVSYAWSLSHTNIWAEILTILNYQELSDKLKTIFKMEQNNET